VETIKVDDPIVTEDKKPKASKVLKQISGNSVIIMTFIGCPGLGKSQLGQY